MTNLIFTSIKKFSKGLFALLTLNLVVVLCVFIFNSCKKAVYENSDAKKANARFVAALDKTKHSIATVALAKINNNYNVRTLSVAPVSDEVNGYIQFPNEVTSATNTMFQATNSIEALANLLYTQDAVLQYDPTPTNSNYQINLPVETVKDNLNPLVEESKQFLYSKGFTEEDIQKMIAEEHAEETDLIPLVMIVTQAENGQLVAKNYLNLLPIRIANANVDWGQVGHCALHAVGMDVVTAFAASGASVWTTAAISTAFRSVTKRALGPIGAAIAVIDFSFCMSGNPL